MVLKGYTANTDFSLSRISQFHINALSDVINELQSRILEDKLCPKGAINENI